MVRPILIVVAVCLQGNDVVSAVASVVPSVVPIADPTVLANTFKYPYSELMVWAVLLRRQRMAKLMWQLGDENIAKVQLLLVSMQVLHWSSADIRVGFLLTNLGFYGLS